MFKKVFFILWLPLSMSFSAQALPVKINTANADVIADSLKGIGEKKAQAIVDYRQQHGHFKTADDLVNVKGIGVATVKKNRHDIIIDATKTYKVVKNIPKKATETLAKKADVKKTTPNSTEKVQLTKEKVTIAQKDQIVTKTAKPKASADAKQRFEDKKEN